MNRDHRPFTINSDFSRPMQYALYTVTVHTTILSHVISAVYEAGYKRLL